MTNSIPHILNLVCLAKTGQPLPSAVFGDNRWGYKKRGDGKKLAIYRGVPDINPTIIHDDPEFRIPRINLITELEECWSNRNRDNFIKTRFIASLLYGAKEWALAHHRDIIMGCPEYGDVVYKLIANIKEKDGFDARWQYIHFKVNHEKIGLDEKEVSRAYIRSLIDCQDDNNISWKIGSQFQNWLDNLNFHLDLTPEDTKPPTMKQLEEEECWTDTFTDYRIHAVNGLWGGLRSYGQVERNTQPALIKLMRVCFDPRGLPKLVKRTEEQADIWCNFYARPRSLDSIENSICAHKATNGWRRRSIISNAGNLKKKKSCAKSLYELIMVGIGSSLDYRRIGDITCADWGYDNRSKPDGHNFHSVFYEISEFSQQFNYPAFGRWFKDASVDLGFYTNLETDEILRIFNQISKEKQREKIMDKVKSNFQ